MSKVILTLALIIFLPIYSLPTSANLVPSPQITPNQDEYRYEYADGSGNLYLIGADSIDYRPITRAESSSGMYDGGTPRTVKLDSGKYQAISVMLDRALNLKSIQIDNGKMGREKGTGLISKHSRDRQIRHRVISSDSQDRQEIESLLDRLMSER
jgi:hypothetical protein